NVTYQFYGRYGDEIVRRYDLDYPLLYLNLQPLGALWAGQDPRPFMRNVTPLPVGVYGPYFLSADTTPVDVIVDGQEQSVALHGPYTLSYLIGASTIETPAGSSTQLIVYAPVRYVFPSW